MERDSYLDGIHSAWLGEQFGRAFFMAMATQVEGEMQTKWRTLAELEQVTGDRMAALLAKYDQAPRMDSPAEVPQDVLARYTEASHQDAMVRMRETVEKAIVHFDRLLAVAPEEDIEDVQFLVRHEQALLAFVECEIAGTGDSLAETRALLA